MGCGLCSAIQSRMYALVPSSFFGPPQGLTPININPGFSVPSHKLCRHRNNIHKANPLTTLMLVCTIHYSSVG